MTFSGSASRWQRRLFPLLFPLGRLYGLGMRLRRLSYERGIVSSWRPPVPCVSVGNIAWGGSGKTPLCSWLLDRLADQGLKPVLLTRGYKARPPAAPYLVTPESSTLQAGDEPLLLARSCPQASVLVDPDRARAGQWALSRLAPDAFVLDDGFQHRGVQRDIDLLLLRPQDLTGEWNRVVPAGSWREDRSALGAASAFLVNCAPHRFHDLQPVMEERLGPLARPVFSMHLEASGCVDRAGSPIPDPAGRPYVLVTGIAGPDKAVRTAAGTLGEAPRIHLAFADHHAYTPRDWTAIIDAAQRSCCDTIVCTPKDMVKLAPLGDHRLCTLALELRFGPSLLTRETFPAWFDRAWRTPHQD